MRNRQLHSALDAFVGEAAWQLAAETANGAEVPFEIVDSSGRRDAPLYCYRPLTGDFIAQRSSILGRMPSYVPAVHALASCGGLAGYLEANGEAPAARGSAGSEGAEAALRIFLGRVFDESTDFVLAPERFDRAYAELEAELYEGRTDTVVIAPLRGLALGSSEVVLGDGLMLIAAAAFPEEAPAAALRATDGGRPGLLAVLRWEGEVEERSPQAHARRRLRRLLVALRLFDAGGVAFGPLGWTRTGGAAWQPFALGALGHRDLEPIVVSPDQEDELRAFCSLVARRTPRGGEVAWALRRFELACDRPSAEEALTDLLLAARALLEPEGPTSGRLAGRLGALCALPEHRAALAERIAHVAALERTVMAGLAVDPALDELVAELTDHLRALLRDVLCGHLDSDLRSVADDILAEGAGFEQPSLV